MTNHAVHSTVIRPSILYYGTPVVLITTQNANRTANISAMSSAWALGDRVVLGMAETGQGLENVERERECVINLPGPDLWEAVERLAPTTGRRDVPEFKRAMGYRFVEDKFREAGLVAVTSDLVRPPRIADCPLQLEAQVLAVHRSQPPDFDRGPASFCMIETKVVRVHAHPAILEENGKHVDVTKWSPLLYVFRHYFRSGARLGQTFKAEAPGDRQPQADAAQRE